VGARAGSATQKRQSPEKDHFTYLIDEICRYAEKKAFSGVLFVGAPSRPLPFSDVWMVHEDLNSTKERLHGKKRRRRKSCEFTAPHQKGVGDIDGGLVRWGPMTCAPMSGTSFKGVFLLRDN